MQVDLDAPVARRALALAAVAALHVLLIAALLSQSAAFRAVAPSILPARLIPAAPKQRPPPPRIVAPPLLQLPVPDIKLAPPEQAAAPRAITRAPQTAPKTLHFGAGARDAGLGLDIGAASGGGAAGRGNLAAFEAAVKQRVLARKRQPALAWDRRNTCVVNYTVTISSTGALAGLSIDPCAIPEINQAARDAITQAAPFPLPPDLGVPRYAVHGTLIFHP